MTDPTEDIRRKLLVEINAQPGSREYLEAKHGQVWDTRSCPMTSRCWASSPPRRRSSQERRQKGSLMFQAAPGSTSALSRIARDTTERGVEDDAPFSRRNTDGSGTLDHQDS